MDEIVNGLVYTLRQLQHYYLHCKLYIDKVSILDDMKFVSKRESLKGY